MHKEALGNVISKTTSGAMVARELCKVLNTGRFLHAQSHTVLLLTFMAIHLGMRCIAMRDTSQPMK